MANRSRITHLSRSSVAGGVSGVYEIVNPASGCRYVGASERCIRNRLAFHKARLRNGKHGNPDLAAAFAKLGWEGFEVYVTPLDKDVVLAEESKKIDYWSARGKCMNYMRQGRRLRFSTPSDGSQSEKAKARCTPEWRAAVSKRVRQQHADGRFRYNLASVKPRKVPGSTHGLKGRKQSPEHLAALAASRRNKRGPDLP